MTRRKHTPEIPEDGPVYIYMWVWQINEAGWGEQQTGEDERRSGRKRDAFQSVIPYVIHRPDAQINAI